MFGNQWPTMNRFDVLRREMDRLWDAFGTGASSRSLARGTAYPAMNIWDAGDTLCAEAEVPGVSKEDLEIFAIGNELTIKGRRQAMEGKLTYHRRERDAGEFTRAITLPNDVNPDKIEAVLDNGVLTIRLPKAESAKPRQITVKAG